MVIPASSLSCFSSPLVASYPFFQQICPKFLTPKLDSFLFLLSDLQRLFPLGNKLWDAPWNDRELTWVFIHLGSSVNQYFFLWSYSYCTYSHIHGTCPTSDLHLEITCRNEPT